MDDEGLVVEVEVDGASAGLVEEGGGGEIGTGGEVGVGEGFVGVHGDVVEGDVGGWAPGVVLPGGVVGGEGEVVVAVDAGVDVEGEGGGFGFVGGVEGA